MAQSTGCARPRDFVAHSTWWVRTPLLPSRKHSRQQSVWQSKFVCVSAQAADQLARTASASGTDPVVSASDNTVQTGTWQWQGYSIRYQSCGSKGPAVVLVHGFGGNCAHWRKNLPVLGLECRAFSIDLLGYGYSDKPNPKSQEPNALYNFETWGRQLTDFIHEVAGEPAFIMSNSVGGIAALQAGVDQPEWVRGVQLQNVSLRMLHASKQAAWQRPLVKALQNTLRTTALGPVFFKQIANPKGVKSILKEAYGDPATVTDELVDCILQPGLQPGAVDVFLDFISYSGGPLAEELLERISCPVSILWGEKDPWEKLEWGREFQKHSAVEEFVVLPGVGHCPMDEAPHLVNPAMLKFVQRHCDNMPVVG